MKQRIGEIDALRGFACLIVLFHHFGYCEPLSRFGLSLGVTGVDLFFIISGFVIALTIQNTNWKGFLINRFSRLFPTYWFCVTLSALAISCTYSFINEPAPTTYFFETFLANLTMLQYYLAYPNLDGSYWTLIIELLFYVLIFLFIVSQKKDLVEIGGAILLIFPLLVALFQNQTIANVLILQVVNKVPLIIYFPLFFSGIIFFKLKFSGVNVLRFAGLICCLILQLSLFTKFYSNAPVLTFSQYALILTIFYILFTLYVFDKLGFIVNKYSIWLGNISFTLYLIHQSIGVQVVIPFFNNYFGINFWISLIITLVIILFLAHVITKFIEKPSIQFLRKKQILASSI